MNNLNVVGVDLAKNIIQVSVVSPAGKELQNKALTRKKFSEFLARQKPSLVAFEACAMAHYWSRIAQQHGHTAKIIPAKAVTPFRQEIPIAGRVGTGVRSMCGDMNPWACRHKPIL